MAFTDKKMVESQIENWDKVVFSYSVFLYENLIFALHINIYNTKKIDFLFLVSYL